MRASIVLLLLAALITGCGRRAAGPHPPEVRWGEDTCAHCRMIVDDARCAAALQPADGDALVFDDVAELFTWLDQHPDSSIAGAWVHDFDSGTWIDAATASYVVGTGFPTPMGGAIIAASTGERALALAARKGGRVTDQTDARASIHTRKERNPR